MSNYAPKKNSKKKRRERERAGTWLEVYLQQAPHILLLGRVCIFVWIEMLRLKHDL
jgi:hypothetical protein